MLKFMTYYRLKKTNKTQSNEIFPWYGGVLWLWHSRAPFFKKTNYSYVLWVHWSTYIYLSTLTYLYPLSTYLQTLAKVSNSTLFILKNNLGFKEGEQTTQE